jgi:hypothetical protein
VHLSQSPEKPASRRELGDVCSEPQDRAGHAIQQVLIANPQRYLPTLEKTISAQINTFEVDPDPNHQPIGEQWLRSEQLAAIIYDEESAMELILPGCIQGSRYTDPNG